MALGLFGSPHPLLELAPHAFFTVTETHAAHNAALLNHSFPGNNSNPIHSLRPRLPALVARWERKETGDKRYYAAIGRRNMPFVQTERPCETIQGVLSGACVDCCSHLPECTFDL